MRRLMIGIAAGVLLAFGVAVASLWRAYVALAEPMPVNESVQFEIPPGASMARVASLLEERSLIDSARSLYWYARYTGQAESIKAGEYLLKPGESAIVALDRFVAGEVVLHAVTLVEGWTARQALATIQAHPAVESTLAAEDHAAILAVIDAVEPHPEGLFFPSTYHFSRGTTDAGILRQAYGLMRQQLRDAWASRTEGLPFDEPYQALILASIIEKETALDEERRQISGVFVRRLKKNMRLQTDPTVIYGLGENFDGDIRRRDLTTDTPYNTYTRAGLPPTPIALPGAASINAAVNPDQGSALYFVATGEGDGSHYFSATRKEHEAAVERYLRRLRNR